MERLLEEITNHKLYASKASELNDPFEGVGVYPFNGYAGVSISLNLGLLPPAIKEYSHTHRLVALTELYDSPQMWAHYATSYTGVCLCIDTSYIRDSIEAVRYSDVPVKVLGNAGDAMLSGETKRIPAGLVVKQRDWAYEQEWRAIFPDSETDDGFIDYGGEALKAVIIGHRCPESARSLIRDACDKVGAKVYITAPQECRYGLGIWPEAFKLSMDGRSIESEIAAYCEETGEVAFERLCMG